jgi:hypothetical protein
MLCALTIRALAINKALCEAYKGGDGNKLLQCKPNGGANKETVGYENQSIDAKYSSVCLFTPCMGLCRATDIPGMLSAFFNPWSEP